MEIAGQIRATATAAGALTGRAAGAARPDWRRFRPEQRADGWWAVRIDGRVWLDGMPGRLAQRIVRVVRQPPGEQRGRSRRGRKRLAPQIRARLARATSEAEFRQIADALRRRDALPL